MSFGLLWLERDRRTGGGNPLLEEGPRLVVRRVASEPVPRPRQLPCGFEVLRILLEP